MSDWGVGRYEAIATGLLPAAAAVVRYAAPKFLERVVDVGCGTGNASIISAFTGAHVTGVDPSEQLLEAATDRARARGLNIRFIPGEAAALPFGDGQVDVVISVFGVIFAGDAAAAVSELARVTGESGRIVLSAWVPEGGLFELMRLRREALAAANGGQPAAAPFAWHDPTALERAFFPHSFSIEVREDVLTFTGGSAREFLDRELRDHPLWVAARGVLEPRGEWDRLYERAWQLLEGANEDRSTFRLTSRFAIVRAQRR